jgi:5-methyltetrahydropteroyltriglutamate--homocysteine methyltransferase
VLRAAYERDARHLVDLQKRNDFTYVTDGQVTWQDLFRPFAENVSGLAVDEGITRWFETNTFYRRPVITGPITYRHQNLDGKLTQGTAPEPNVLSVPGLYTFARLAHTTTSIQPGEVMKEYAKLIIELLCDNIGIDLLQLHEPSLVYDEEIVDEEGVKAAYRKLRDFDTYLSVHTYFGDAAPRMRLLRELGIGRIGIDLTRTQPDDLEPSADFTRYELQVVDSESSLIEDPEKIAREAEAIAQKLHATDINITNTAGLVYVPQVIADKKTEALAKAAKIIGGNDE